MFEWHKFWNRSSSDIQHTYFQLTSDFQKIFYTQFLWSLQLRTNKGIFSNTRSRLQKQTKPDQSWQLKMSYTQSHRPATTEELGGKILDSHSSEEAGWATVLLELTPLGQKCGSQVRPKNPALVWLSLPLWSISYYKANTVSVHLSGTKYLFYSRET